MWKIYSRDIHKFPERWGKCITSRHDGFSQPKCFLKKVLLGEVCREWLSAYRYNWFWINQRGRFEARDVVKFRFEQEGKLPFLLKHIIRSRLKTYADWGLCLFRRYISGSHSKYSPPQRTHFFQRCFHFLKQSLYASSAMTFSSFVAFALISEIFSNFLPLRGF